MKKTITLIISVILLNSCTIDSKLIGDSTPKSTNTSTTDQALTNKDTNTNSTEPTKLKESPVTQVQAIPDTLVITEGNKVKGTASVIYNDNSRSSDLIWSSSDNTIATVNPTTGEISGGKPGVVTIVATAQRDSSKKTSITVTVKRADVTESLTKVTPESSTLKIGETVRLNASIQMSDGSISPNVIWKSDNLAVVTVSNGLVTGISEGSTTVTAIAEGDSTKQASSKITVVKASSTPASTTL